MQPPPDPSNWPFALGDGPFKVKGLIFSGVVRFLTQHHGGSLTSAFDGNDDAALAAYFAQPFSGESWYDAHALTRMHLALAPREGRSFHDHVKLLAMGQLRLDLAGTYERMLRLAGTAEGVLSMSNLARSRFDFAPPQILERSDHRLVIERHGFPVGLVPWYEGAAMGYCDVVFDLTKATNGRCAVELEPERYLERGVDAATLRWIVTWD